MAFGEGGGNDEGCSGVNHIETSPLLFPTSPHRSIAAEMVLATHLPPTRCSGMSKDCCAMVSEIRTWLPCGSVDHGPLMYCGYPLLPQVRRFLFVSQGYAERHCVDIIVMGRNNKVVHPRGPRLSRDLLSASIGTAHAVWLVTKPINAFPPTYMLCLDDSPEADRCVFAVDRGPGGRIAVFLSHPRLLIQLCSSAQSFKDTVPVVFLLSPLLQTT